jgi:tetratricopeptide (TPR) repeat protein
MLSLVATRLPAAYYSYRADRVLSTWEYLEKPELAREAEKWARLALERDPKNPELYRTLGETQVALGIHTRHLPEERERYYRESVEIYQKALALAPMDRNLVLALAWSLDDMKRYAEAGELFERALELDPNSGQILAAYANHLELQGRLDEARALYQKAAERGTMSAIFQLDKMKQSPKAPRSGLEDDVPKLGR